MANNIPLYKDPIENKHKAKFDENKVRTAILILKAVSTGLDEAAFTPFRDLQVFGNQYFSKIAGPHHTTASLIGLAFSAIATLPYIARLFHKNETNTLKGLLKNLEMETGHVAHLDEPITRQKLQNKFNEILQKKGLAHYQEARIEKNKNGEYDIKFYYKANSLLKKIFAEQWSEYKKYNFLGISKELLGKEIFPDEITNLSPENLEIINANLYKKLTNFKSDIALPTGEPYEVFAALIKLWVQTIHSNPHYYEQVDKKGVKINKDFCDSMLAYAKIYPAFFDQDKKKFIEDDFEQCRTKALKHVNEHSVVRNTFDTITNYTQWFWLAFFPVDMLENQSVTNLWTPKFAPAIVLFAALGAIITDISLKVVNYFKNKFRKKDLDSGIELKDIKKGKQSANTKDVELTDSFLKHQLLEEYFIETIKKDRLAKAVKNRTTTLQLKPDATEQDKQKVLAYKAQISRLLAAKDPSNINIIEESDWKKLDRKAQARIKKKNASLKVANQIELLKQESNTEFTKQNSFKRFFTGIGNVLGKGVELSFWGWALGVFLFAVGAAAAGAIILSNPVGIAVFGLGMVIGGIYTYFAVKKERAAEANLREQLEQEKDNIAELKRLEIQNRKLESLIIACGKEPLKIVKAHDDRGLRRLTTEKDKVGTLAKKGAARSAVTVGRAGTGILIVRLVVLPILALTTSALIGGPIGLAVALGFGVFWAAMNLYKYHRDSKLTAAQRTLDDIETRIQLERDNQEIMLKQLGYNPETDNIKNNEAELQTSTENSATQHASATNSSIKLSACSNLLFFSTDTTVNQQVIAKIKALGKARKEYDQSNKSDSLKEELMWQATDLKELLGSKKIDEFRSDFKTKNDLELFNLAKTTLQEYTTSETESVANTSRLVHGM